MFIGAWATLKPGDRRTGLTDKHGTWHPEMPFVVLRSASFEEFRTYALSIGATDITPFPNAKYYEVSTD